MLVSLRPQDLLLNFCFTSDVSDWYKTKFRGQFSSQRHSRGFGLERVFRLRLLDIRTTMGIWKTSRTARIFLISENTETA